ncbi:MAG: hypothetical protein N6V41_01720, partial [Candidatus Portiera aleyrodidarum]|nr:hypothetical protein [Candidatus Portiera aleyrodidarum]
IKIPIVKTRPINLNDTKLEWQLCILIVFFSQNFKQQQQQQQQQLLVALIAFNSSIRFKASKSLNLFFLV